MKISKKSTNILYISILISDYSNLVTPLTLYNNLRSNDDILFAFDFSSNSSKNSASLLFRQLPISFRNS